MQYIFHFACPALSVPIGRILSLFMCVRVCVCVRRCMPDHFIVVAAVSSKAEMNASRMRIVSRPIKERRCRRSIASAPGVRSAVEQVQNVALEASVFSLHWFDLLR